MYKPCYKGKVMKKMTLLFTVLGASQLYGAMEVKNIRDLPRDIHSQILNAAFPESKDNLDEAIKAIKATGAAQGLRYDNLKDFTRLMHVLAKKFNTGPHNVINSPYGVAEKFKTPLAEKYVKLADELELQIISDNIAGIQELITKGVDVTANTAIVYFAIFTSPTPNAEIIQLLLDNGANPNARGGNGRGQTPLELVNHLLKKTPEWAQTEALRYEQIKALLEKVTS